MTAVAPPETDTQIVDGLPIEDYHRHPTLSSTGARKLLPPSCPALYRYEADNPQPAKKVFELGHAAHKLVLGEGPEIVLVDAPRWDTNAIKAELAAIRAAGNVPLKKPEYDQVHAMAKALREHPIAGALFAPGSGTAERSLFWRDEATGVDCRARPDWIKQLPSATLAVDYKSAIDASPTAVEKVIYDRGYYQQDPWYQDGLAACGLAPHGSRFIFVFQQKTPPYLITVRELAETDRALGRAKNRRALEIYAQCAAADTWPDWTGPTDHIPVISLPPWAANRESEEYMR